MTNQDPNITWIVLRFFQTRKKKAIETKLDDWGTKCKKQRKDKQPRKCESAPVAQPGAPITACPNPDIGFIESVCDNVCNKCTCMGSSGNVTCYNDCIKGMKADVCEAFITEPDPTLPPNAFDKCVVGSVFPDSSTICNLVCGCCNVFDTAAGVPCVDACLNSKAFALQEKVCANTQATCVNTSGGRNSNSKSSSSDSSGRDDRRNRSNRRH